MGFLQIQVIHVLAIIILVTIAATKSTLSATPPNFPIAKPNCVDRCGNLSIPYPFGTTPDCYLSYSFLVTCDQNSNPSRTLIQKTSIEIIDLSLDGRLKALQFKFSDFFRLNETECSGNNPWINLPPSFTLNNTENMFTPISCRMYGIIDWAIGNDTCEVAQMNASSYACKSPNSRCYKPENGHGYRCSCLDGYKGNPYLFDGCKDVNECEDPHLNICEKRCVNTMGGFHCACPKLYYGDGRKDGRGCIRGGSLAFKLVAVVVVVMGLITLLSISFGLRKFVKKIKHKIRRKKFFKQNRGLLLQKQISVQEGQTILGNVRIFTANELEKATDRFNESRILGRGGQGIVYKGMLSDGQIVAIKKSPLVNENKSDHLVKQFINEVVILSQINHRNVVRLLGCCLETKVPLLVYEFVPNGTLFYHIHDDNNGNEFPFSWTMRLKIATDVAGALTYLHSATSLPIFHRDIKSSNILLDEKYVAKVSDFGTSKSLAADQTHITTRVNGTFGYIDPEYFRSSQFTEKSDVYSFGVVLVELLTGLKPIIPTSNEEDEKSLVMHFLSSMNEDKLGSILDIQVAVEDEMEGVVAVADLAKRCLNSNGKERPNMKEVAMELENVRIAQMGSHVHTRLQEDSMIFSRDNYDHAWTSPIDIETTSSCDVHPIMFDTI